MALTLKLLCSDPNPAVFHWEKARCCFTHLSSNCLLYCVSQPQLTTASQRKAVLKMPPSKGKQAHAIQRLSQQKKPRSHEPRCSAVPPPSSGVFFATAPSLSRPHLFAVRSVYFYFDVGRLNLATDFDALVEAETEDLQLRLTSCFFKLFASSFFFYFFFSLSPVAVGESCFGVEWHRGKFFHVESTVRPYCSSP